MELLRKGDNLNDFNGFKISYCDKYVCATYKPGTCYRFCHIVAYPG